SNRKKSTATFSTLDASEIKLAQRDVQPFEQLYKTQESTLFKDIGFLKDKSNRDLVDDALYRNGKTDWQTEFNRMRYVKFYNYTQRISKKSVEEEVKWHKLIDRLADGSKELERLKKLETKGIPKTTRALLVEGLDKLLDCLIDVVTAYVDHLEPYLRNMHFLRSSAALLVAFSALVSARTQNAPCTNFGEWHCDSTGTKLLQCAYAASSSLTWYWSGASCALLPESDSDDTPATLAPKPTSTKRKQTATAPPKSQPTTESAPLPEHDPQPEPQPEPNPIPQPDPGPIPTLPDPQPDPVPIPEIPTQDPIPLQPALRPNPPSTTANVLISGSGDGTYYYDFTGHTCPHEAAYPENGGYTSCEPSAPPYLTIGQRQDNFIVALALDQMNTNKANLCGKRVNVKYNGVPVAGNFVVWDSCAACTGGVRLDFSLSALESINGNACQMGVVPGISWEVTDEQVIPYIP
ncbi:UNVERIFIED_CONTAM: hypothetical protein HDU68_004012, partial [Siphonaria sp. JEL0065]